MSVQYWRKSSESPSFLCGRHQNSDWMKSSASLCRTLSWRHWYAEQIAVASSLFQSAHTANVACSSYSPWWRTCITAWCAIAYCSLKSLKSMTCFAKHSGVQNYGVLHSYLSLRDLFESLNLPRFRKTFVHRNMWNRNCTLLHCHISLLCILGSDAFTPPNLSCHWYQDVS